MSAPTHDIRKGLDGGAEMETATAPLTPMSERDTENTISQHRDDESIAGGVAWELLVHDAAFGPNLARLVSIPVPDGLDLDDEDIEGALFALLTEAAQIGYRMARLDLSPFDRKQVTTSDVARALAALLHRPTVEDGQPFDLEYLNKRAAAADAEYRQSVKAVA
jgi:hypothetical protein